MTKAIILLCTAVLSGTAFSTSSRAAEAAAPAFDAALAQQVGADEHGMRSYVLVILKTGPTPLPKGEKRDEMFKGTSRTWNVSRTKESWRWRDRSTAPTAGVACSSSR